MKKVVVIVGPTASGKTSLSLELAKHYNTEIINGDSVQVYQGLNIGSAKIKESEKQSIKHHLLDICFPATPYSVYQFQQAVRSLIPSIHLPLIVGGTGLYIKAALYNYEFIERKRDESFDEKIKSMTNEELYQELLKRDPHIIIDAKNRRRLSRAYEQALEGYPRSEKTKKDELLYDALIIYLDLPKDILDIRLKERLERQFNEGFIEEVQSLRNQNLHMDMIGYRELDRYLSGDITLDEAKDAIIRVSKKLAKKQKTWFKNQMNPIIVEALSPTLKEEVITIIDSFMKR